MATDSPMSNFNRKNPYVIQVKQKYEILMRMYEEISKSLIICNFAVFTALVIQNMFGFFTHNLVFTLYIWTPVIILATILIDQFYIKNTIKDSVNHQIDDLVTMESNEVIKVNIEFVQELLYTVSTCIGKVNAYMQWFNLYTICTMAFTGLTIFIFIIK